MKQVLTVFLVLFASLALFAQEDMKQLKYDDMSAFRDQAGNWFLVGDVLMNPTVDIHAHEEAPEPEDTSKKKRKKKKKKNAPPPPKPKAVIYEEGTGVLLNMNNDTKKDQLLTTWEHGDMIFETEVMIPKGSNSGIYLQGRYEVQLLDSWGVKSPRYGDIGGIYRNWETEPGQIYMGKAPFTNAAFAPGVWQHLKIAFKAPRFNEQGEKIANATFVYVDLNGIRIHENLEVPLPTGGPIEKNEVAKGPLMIQGDHGPVAFRNTKYQLMESADIKLTDIKYKAWEGSFNKVAEFIDTEPLMTGELETLTFAVKDWKDKFAVQLTANLEAPADGHYKVKFDYVGAMVLKVGEKTLIDEQFSSGNQGNKIFTLDLKKGGNPLEIIYYKDWGWRPAMLGVFEANSFSRPLHSFSSYSAGAPNYSPIYVEAESTPKMLRAFYDFKGDRSQRLTHTIGVADPSGVNYIYDLTTGTPVCVWRGEFVDATSMWHNRGNGSFRPRGANRDLFTGLTVADLPTGNEAFPREMNEENGFHNKGYKIDENSSRPVFIYTLNGVSFEDHLNPADEGKSIMRTLKVIEGAAPATVKVKLAEGEEITKLETGEYSIDKKYFIQLAEGQTASIRNVDGKQELIMPLSAEASYKLIW